MGSEIDHFRLELMIEEARYRNRPETKERKGIRNELIWFEAEKAINDAREYV